MTNSNGFGWYQDFRKNALEYPGEYPLDVCEELFAKGLEIRDLLLKKGSQLFVHYYQRPESQKLADVRGDSLFLAMQARKLKPQRIDYQAVNFMAQTAKIIVGNDTRVYVSDSSKVLGCSLVEGTDYDWVESWKKEYKHGKIVSYINSSPYLKSLSDYICTSSNATAIIVDAIQRNAGEKILILPDKFLGYIMKNGATSFMAQHGIPFDPGLIDVYDQPFGGYHACCYVHEQFGPDQIDVAMIEHPDAEILIHPECGCATVCMRKLLAGEIPYEKAFVSSTKGMIERAILSSSKEFIVATEAGHLYTLREQVPGKTFYPVNPTHCKFMKGNSFDKLLRSLREDCIEIVICEQGCSQCTDPRHPYEDGEVSHLPRNHVEAARKGIERMLAIQ